MARPKRDSLALQKRPVYELTGEYLDSKAATTGLYRPYVCGDDISENNVRISNYLSLQRLDTVEVLLQGSRQSALEKKKELDKEWAELQRQEDELRQIFMDLNQFIVDNTEKRKRAKERISEENETLQKRKEQVADMTKKHEELREVKDRMDKKIVQYSKYEDFLNSVVEMNPADFESILDVLNRYDVIKYTSEELVKQQERNVNRLSEIQYEFDRKVDGYIVTINGMNTRVSKLLQRHEAAKRAGQHWEEMYERTRAAATERLTDTVAIRDSCRRMYLEICERKGVRPRHVDNTERQLMTIKKALRDYRAMNDMQGRMEAEEYYASERPRASYKSD